MQDEWDRDPEMEVTDDLLFVTFDPAAITADQILARIKDEGFEAELK